MDVSYMEKPCMPTFVHSLEATVIFIFSLDVEKLQVYICDLSIGLH